MLLYKKLLLMTFGTTLVKMHTKEDAVETEEACSLLVWKTLQCLLE